MQRGRIAVFHHLLGSRMCQRRVQIAELFEVFENRPHDLVDDIPDTSAEETKVAPTPKVVTSSSLPRYMPPGIVATR